MRDSCRSIVQCAARPSVPSTPWNLTSTNTLWLTNTAVVCVESPFRVWPVWKLTKGFIREKSPLSVRCAGRHFGSRTALRLTRPYIAVKNLLVVTHAGNVFPPWEISVDISAYTLEKSRSNAPNAGGSLTSRIHSKLTCIFIRERSSMCVTSVGRVLLISEIWGAINVYKSKGIVHLKKKIVMIYSWYGNANPLESTDFYCIDKKDISKNIFCVPTKSK